MQTKHLLHKMGGRVTAIHAVGHRTLDHVPYWFYICDVTWNDGKKSERIEVMPDRLCYDVTDPAGLDEINAASNYLTSYLSTHGTWLKKAKWVGERLVHWTAKRPNHAWAI